MGLEIIWKDRSGGLIEGAAVCEHCSQSVYQKLSFGRAEAFMLYLALKKADTRKVEYKVQVAERTDPARIEEVERCVTVDDFDGHSQYANVSRLKWWGLLRVDPAWRRNGIYQVTSKADEFVWGGKKLACHLLKKKAEDVIVAGGYDPETGRLYSVSFQEAAREDWLEIGEYIKRAIPAAFAPAGQLGLTI